MTLEIILIFIAVFATVTALSLVITSPGPVPLDARLTPYDARPTTPNPLATPFAERVLLPLLASVARLIRRISPAQVDEELRLKLAQAGNPAGLDVNRYLAVRGLLFLGLPLLVGVPRFLTGSLDLQAMFLVVVLAGMGWRLPSMWLNQKIGARRTAITRALPDTLDLLVVCVEAGNSLEGALAIVVERLGGPLGEEFERTLREMHLGKMRAEAMRDLAKRAASPELQTFIAAVLQADQLGVGVAQVLRVQGDAMRVRRRQHAEEQAAKAPVKMLIPLVLFILPSLMIIIMGPAVVNITAFFTSHGP